ncbi:MAG: manganese efflux pump [Lachnospiraceae bacterium]
MEWNLLFFFNSVLLGAGLAMDAFSVSLANGLNEPGMKTGRMCGVAGVYAVFQAVVPMMGWGCVHTILQYFRAFEKCIPWIALILLLYIGGKMLIEGLKHETDVEEEFRLGLGALMIQGIATSIDALAVGLYHCGVWLCDGTCLFPDRGRSDLHNLYGWTGDRKKIWDKSSNKAAILGGIILILIGIEIFATGIL